MEKFKRLKTDLGDARPDCSRSLYIQIEAKNKDCGHEMILMLEKVGFGNIHSAISSMIYRIATASTQMMEELKGDIVTEEQHKYLNFNGEYTKKFFFETMRLAPPVWLQARKVGKNSVQINDTKLPPYTLVLIPNFILARHIRKEDPHDFNPDAVNDIERANFNPFSSQTSPNSCVGRYIAVPMMEILFGEMLSNYDLYPVHVTEEYKGKLHCNSKII